MTRAPIEHEELCDQIRTSEAAMAPAERRLWHLIRIAPIKWRQEPWGNQGGGFWVVGIFGDRIIWYNDIEDGFNTSRYVEHGVIGEYWCNQDELEDVLYLLHRQIEIGEAYGGSGGFGAPQPIA